MLYIKPWRKSAAFIFCAVTNISIAIGGIVIMLNLKFDELIAADAGIGRPALCVFLTEIRDNFLLEMLPEINDVVGNPESNGYIVGILCGLPAAAASQALSPAEFWGKRKKLHRHSDDLIAFFLEQGCGC